MAASSHLRLIADALRGSLSWGELNERLAEDGAPLLALLVAIPFLQPVPLAGLSMPAGAVIALAGWRTALSRGPMPLPSFAARRRFSEASARRLLATAEAVLWTLERVSRPRLRPLARSGPVVGLGLFVSGLTLALPVFVPFGSTTCSLPVVLLSAAALEDDGVLGLLGLLAAALNVAYHGAFLALLLNAVRALLPA